MSPFCADYIVYLFLTKELVAWDLMTVMATFSWDNAFHNGKPEATVNTICWIEANIFIRVTLE